jgi:hypothetical protein
MYGLDCITAPARKLESNANPGRRDPLGQGATRALQSTSVGDCIPFTSWRGGGET